MSSASARGGVASVRAAAYADGRLEALGIGEDSAVYHTWQSEPGTWVGRWEPLYGDADRRREVALAVLADGRLEALGIGEDGAVYHTWQSEPGTWVGRWEPLYGD